MTFGRDFRVESTSLMPLKKGLNNTILVNKINTCCNIK
jgi:hypothetical protein